MCFGEGPVTVGWPFFPASCVMMNQLMAYGGICLPDGGLGPIFKSKLNFVLQKTT
jgi:hypothetical protein